MGKKYDSRIFEKPPITYTNFNIYVYFCYNTLIT